MARSLTKCGVGLSVASIAALALSGCILAEGSFPTEQVVTNGAYGSGPAQTWDVIAPLPDPCALGLRPAVIILAGGNWETQTPPTDPIGQYLADQPRLLAEHFASRGYVAFLPNYTLDDDTSPVDPIVGSAGQNIATPVGSVDVAPTMERARRAFVDVLVASDKVFADGASEYCIDTSKISIGGMSAGAFMAISAGYGHGDFGITPRNYHSVFSLTGGANLLDGDTDLSSGPPAFVGYDESDPLIPQAYHDELVTGLANAGVSTTVYSEDNGTHFILLGQFNVVSDWVEDQ